jgi:hypothetical protein
VDSYIYLQDPGDTESPTVLESLLAACEDADAGGAAFAFASVRGIATLFSDKVFKKFVRRAPFDLVVGLDSITNVASLEKLKEESQRYSKLNARAFLHDRTDGIFHPKFAWFRDEDGGRSIIGSGNLTPGGLHGNWEAYSELKYGLHAATTVAKEWSEWKKLHEAELRMVDNPAAVARAAKNKWNVIAAPDADDAIFAAPPPPTNSNDVLIAELPAGGKVKPRWAQANFNYDTFTSFFHLHPSATRRVVLWNVDNNGNLGQAEIRQSVAVKSQNFRIELEAAHGLTYPTAGPPIVMFRRVGTRRFRYQLLMPGQSDYAKAATILDNLWSGSGRFKRRVTLSSADLYAQWSNSPLL